METINKITMKTVIPIGMIISIMGGVVAGVWHLSKLTYQVGQHDKILEDVATKEDVAKLTASVEAINTEIKNLYKDNVR